MLARGQKYIPIEMNLDMSIPPSPTSDASSSPRSPVIGNTVEPMDLTDFIGSLNDNNESTSSRRMKSATSPTTKRERNGSVSGSHRDVDAKSRERELRRLLDTNYNYRKFSTLSTFIDTKLQENYVHDEDFDTTHNRASLTAQSPSQDNTVAVEGSSDI